MRPIDKLLERLPSAKMTNKGRWMCKCPAHEDKHPSFGITELDDGRILLKCFKGCEVSDIVHSIGLELHDLFPPRPGHYKPDRKGFSDSQRLQAIIVSARIIKLWAMKTRNGEALSNEDNLAFDKAYEQITQAVEYGKH